MGQLTEAEIFDCLTSNLRSAADNCEKLAKLPRKGPTYQKLRDELELIEGACRQAGFFRDDARWFTIGMMMGEAHKRSGGWLRGVKMPDGTTMKIAAGHMHPLFMKLADNLRAALVKAEEFRTKATGRIGPILPEVQAAPLRDTSPVGWRSSGGILIPESASVH